MNTDITASVKPEYPVIDRNPPFTKTVANFSTLDYLRFTTITGVSVTVGYLSGGLGWVGALISSFESCFSSALFVWRRNKAQHPRPFHGHRRSHRPSGWIHVRLPELRRQAHGLLSQRGRGSSLQETQLLISLLLLLLLSQ